MAIQLLKYHRDINWRNDDDKPISIIITTLATKAYNGEDNLYDALVNICKTMPDYIENRNDTYWVGNPVNENENFADKWKETPRKAQVFFQWLFSLNTLLNNLLDEHIDFSEALDVAYGRNQETSCNNINIVLPKKVVHMTDPIKPWRAQ